MSTHKSSTAPRRANNIGHFGRRKIWTVPCWLRLRLVPQYEFRHQAETACRECKAHDFCVVEPKSEGNCVWLRLAPVKKP